MIQSPEKLGSDTGQPPGDASGRLVTCRLDELHPHPSYARHQLAVPACKLSALGERGDMACLEPLAITQDRTIIDGYARWELARQRRRLTLPCIEYDLSEQEALHWLLQRHQQSIGLNGFIRILLALDLEPSLQEKARLNQRAGGQNKGSSKLTEAERLHVRSQVAGAAGVSAGNVTKVKQLMTAAHSDLLAALRDGDISIHRAWTWCKLPQKEQREALWSYRSERGLNKKIRTLLLQHRPKNPSTAVDFADLVEKLSAADFRRLGPVSVAVTDVPGKALVVTKELLRALGLQQMTICATNNR